MRYFAKIDSNNIVINVIVAEDEEFVKNLDGNYIETFESVTAPAARAAKGYTYDASKKAFFPPKPYPSWVFDTTLHTYKAPVTYPTHGKKVEWDEDSTSWKEVE
tara:strand:- start:242 stop:553 length:312 start_codon:yes stop_codon:yes gene_type:complete